MNNYVCPNAQIIKQGLYQYIKCKVQNDYCLCMRYCPNKKSIEHTDMARYCIYNPEWVEYPKDKK